MHILITGGSGLIGTYLTQFLQQRGYVVSHLSRKMSSDPNIHHWDVSKGEIDTQAFVGVDGIFHLAGANVGDGRWTTNRKKEILDSRLNSTRLLYRTISAMQKKPKFIFSASATGYYGINPFTNISEENDNRGAGFLAEVCENWEKRGRSI